MKFKTLCLAAVIPAIIFTGCSKSGSSSIPAPVASFDWVGVNVAPTLVAFTNTSTDAVSYEWDFGDLSTSTSKSPSHTYTIPGTYTVRLTAKSVSASATASKTVTIKAPASVSIDAVKIIDMPVIDPSCSCAWDISSGPDVFFRLTDNANNILVTGVKYIDASAASLPLLWNYTASNLVAEFPYVVTDFNKIYKFDVYDADAPPADPDDLIGGYSFSFAPYAAVGYPKTITLNVPPGTLKVELALSWR